jgi:pyridoxine/pyridoxamine 5'-phosphate oxidase
MRASPPLTSQFPVRMSTSATNPADLRVERKRAVLDERDVDPDPFRQFARWFDEAVAAQVPEPNAMTLATADAYWISRPRMSQVGAWASPQSQPLPNRAALEERFAQAEARYPGDSVPRPPHWGGYRLVPEPFEFWQGRPSRLHDRMTYERGGANWRIGRLAP